MGSVSGQSLAYDYDPSDRLLGRTHDGRAYQDRYLVHELFGQDVEGFGAAFEVPYRFTGPM